MSKAKEHSTLLLMIQFFEAGEMLYLWRRRWPVWPDLASYWNLGNFSKPVAIISFAKSLTSLGNFCKAVKIFNFLVKSFFGNFYRHLATFYWSHWRWRKYKTKWLNRLDFLDPVSADPIKKMTILNNTDFDWLKIWNSQSVANLINILCS